MQAALSVTRCFARTFVTSVARVQPRPRCSTQLVSAACGFPKDLAYGRSTVQKMDVFGDDALFVARHRSADVMGVADGVGGWHNYGVDPSVFSSSLMRTCARLVEEGRFSPENPANLLAASYRSLMRRYQETSNKKSMQGSSTACVVVLDRAKNAIYTANLGDSGFLVVRDGKVVHRSEEQQHYFNAPFQLSLPPNEESVQFLSDRPEAAAITSFRVEEGDLILLATDGLFDNLPAHLIENELKEFRADDEKSIQRVCNSLALQARRLAFDQDFVSPFAQKAQKHGITDCVGGKPDDITIILAVVTSVQEESVAGENSENKN